MGLRFFRWQGILYKQGGKFATSVADMVSNELITSDKLAARFQAKDVKDIIVKHMVLQTADTCAEIGNEIGEKGTCSIPEFEELVSYKDISLLRCALLQGA